jgi:hypothetical protein
MPEILEEEEIFIEEGAKVVIVEKEKGSNNI